MSPLIRGGQGCVLFCHCEPPSAAKQSTLHSVIPVKTGIQFPYLNSPPGIYPPMVTLAQPENLLLPVILSRRRRICLPCDSSSWLEKPFLRMTLPNSFQLLNFFKLLNSLQSLQKNAPFHIPG